MRVLIQYKNKKLEVTDTVEYDLNDFCQNLSERLIGILSSIETLFDIDTLKENESYLKLRHTLFDVSGSIRRLPLTLVLEPGQRIVWEDELPQPESEIQPEPEPQIQNVKPERVTLNLIQRMFGKGGE